MSEMLGADVAQLRALAKEFSGKSESLTQAQRLLDGAVNQHRGVVARTATVLVQTADQLKTNAAEQEQEQASSVAGLAGNTGGPASGAANPWGPDWLSKGSPFRDGWKNYGNLKNVINLPKDLYGLGWMAGKGWDVLANPAHWAKPAGRSASHNLMESATDLLGLKNFNKYFPQLNSMKGFFAETPQLFKGSKLEWLGKGGAGVLQFLSGLRAALVS